MFLRKIILYTKVMHVFIYYARCIKNQWEKRYSLEQKNTNRVHFNHALSRARL